MGSWYNEFMKIWMVRHGETDSNMAERVMGQRIDEPLNDEGRAQAEHSAEQLRAEPYDIIFSSPLKRAYETAQVIARARNIPIIVRDELKERNFGSLSGKTWPEIDRAAGAEPGTMHEKDYSQQYDYHAFGGESIEDVKRRLLHFTDALKRDYSNKRILIVAHGGILRLARKMFSQVSIGDIRNTELMEFDI